MNEILDATEEPKPEPGTIFSKCALGAAISSILFLLLLIVQFLSYPRSTPPPVRPPLLGIGILGCCLLGVIFSILSLVRREQDGLVKWIGAILNTLMFFLLAMLFIIGN